MNSLQINEALENVGDGSKLDDFTRGYIEAAFFTDASPDAEGELADATIDDMSYVSWKEAIDVCDAFQKQYRKLLDDAADFHDYTMSQAGVDFWLTRNHHGAGFWDRGLGKIGDKLTKAAHGFSSRCLCLGDNGQVYFDLG